MTNIYSEADDIMLLYYFIPTADQNNYHHEFMTMNLLQPIGEYCCRTGNNPHKACNSRSVRREHTSSSLSYTYQR